MKIDEKLLKKIENITYTFYKKENNKLCEDSIYSIIENLVMRYESLEEEFEDFKRDVEYNYRKLRMEEQL